MNVRPCTSFEPFFDSRRTFLRAAGSAGTLLAGGLIGACAPVKHIDVLAPPSTLRPDFIRLFEGETGVQIRPGPWISPTDALGKLFSSSARIDMVVALSDLFTPVIPDAISHNLLTPIDPAGVPNSRHLSEQFRADMFSSDGKLYAIPLYWGYTEVLYNRKNIPASEPLIDSWGLLFDDKFKGKVSLKDDAHESIMPTAIYMGHEHPLDMDRSDLKEVTRFLISKKRNFRALWTKLADAVQLMATGEVNALYGYPLMQQTLAHQGVDIAANRPKEGLLLFVQVAFIPRSGSNPADALKWINFLMRDDIATRLTQEANVLSTSEIVKNRFSAADQHAYGYDALSGEAPLVRLGRPKHLNLWIEAWAEFKAA